MRPPALGAWRDRLRLVQLCTRLVAGRRWWVAPLLTLVWPLVVGLWLVLTKEEAVRPDGAQNALLSIPLSVLAIGLGVRIIAGEVDRRMLEIGYTTPGGVQRLWLGKLTACLGLLVAGEALLAGAAFLFFTSFPPLALYGALQTATFFLVTAMAWGALFRSEVTGALASFAVFLLCSLFQEALGRWSPFWNESAHAGEARADVVAWSLQNRAGYALLILALVALGFARSERREKMLGG